MKIITILGARPQFIKAASVSRAIQASKHLKEVIVHTGQHFDENMSDVFFAQLDIPRPNYNLNIAGLSHGAMTGRMLEGIERVLLKEKPDCVLVYGDTNSTFAGAMAAAKLHIPVVHVEAGLRSHNPAMPEEINRILTDRVSSLLLCPTQHAMKNLRIEGFPFSTIGSETGACIQRIANVGDVMFDAVIYYSDRAKQSISLDAYGLQHKGYALCTLHRQENTDNPVRLNGILRALRTIATEQPVVLPLHPRTRHKLEQLDFDNVLAGLNILDPLPYLEMQRLQMSAQIILTDSGGIQKEAYFHSVPCITLRDETEWVETLKFGWNQLVGADTEKITSAALQIEKPFEKTAVLYGDGASAFKILDELGNI